MAARPNPEILALLNVLSEAYPTFELTKGRISVYCEMLSDLPLDALTAAVRQHIAVNKWPPTIAELREGCTAVTRPALPEWGEAWAEVLSAIQRVGSYGVPSFSHPLIAATVQRMGGWKVMCQMEISETATWRAQFRDMFNAHANRALSTANLLPDVRALAIHNGALPAPAEPAPPALPAPIELPAAPVEAVQPIKFAAYVQKWRDAGRATREAEGRRKAEEGGHVSAMPG